MSDTYYKRLLCNYWYYIDDVIKFILLSSNGFLQAFIKVLYACKKGAASINFCARVFNFMHQSITLHHDAIKTVLYQRKDFDDETNLLLYRELTSSVRKNIR